LPGETRVLWLALHFPLLPIEALPLRQPPSAVVARGRVQVADEAAVAAGVCSGQKLSTALGLQPGLAVFERDAGRERQALESLACWVGRFTPTISLQPPDTLLLEIGGCLRLFGGAEAIIAAVLAGCAEQSYSVRWGGADAARRALAGAAGARALHPTQAAMQAALAGLACSVPDWPPEAVARLAAFGLQRLGDLAQVPAAGLRRRIGNGPVDDLLRARGELATRNALSSSPNAVRSRLPARVEHRSPGLCRQRLRRWPAASASSWCAPA
jgi:protein ImuB